MVEHEKLTTQPIAPHPVAATAITDDQEFHDSVIVKVRPFKDGSGWEFSKTDGTTFWVESRYGIEPRAGDLVRIYGRGLGYPVRGLCIAGRVAYYHATVEDMLASLAPAQPGAQEGGR